MKSLFFLCLFQAISRSNAAFQRVGTFFVCSQISPTCNTSVVTTAEIVTATEDGNTLIYTDGTQGRIGFVNITDPRNPLPAGTVDFPGTEPTSVVVRGGLALAVINTSPSFVNPSGFMAVINITSRTVVRTITLPGMPDCVTQSGNVIAVAIENERDESFNGGNIPQLPPGSVVLIDATNPDPAQWILQNVNITNLPNVDFPTDPEPEFVSINSAGVVAVTLQENNAVVLLSSNGTILASYNMGIANVSGVDIFEERNFINQNASISKRREPDGIAWIDNVYFATANEGDFPDGGSRGFSIFDSRNGSLVYDCGNDIEWLVARIGNYNEDRSSNRGNEPESVLVTVINGRRLLIVLSERSSVVLVYDATNPIAPVFLQVMATSTSGPEGIVAIPSRNMIAVANENDNRANKFRSTISIYQDNFAQPDYPSIQSVPRIAGSQGPFIPFSALSALAASPGFGTLPNNLPTTLYTVEDSFFRSNRIMTIEVTLAGPPYRLTSELTMKDTGGVLNATLATFPSVVLSSRINADRTVNIDPEGIAISRVPNTVWVVSEGGGATAASLTMPNLLLQVSLVSGAILRAITLPPAVNALHTSFGFEGVAEYGDFVVVAFQREWVGETRPRLGIYNYVLNTWKFVFYPLDPYISQFNTGATSWVGLSEISPIGNGRFLVLERDNQGGPDAAIKRLYEIDLGSNLTALADNITVTKTLKLDMIPVLRRTWGFMPEKIEGVAIDSLGNVWVNNDNDGIVNNAGEQQLNLMGQLYFPKISNAPSAAPSRSPVKAPVKAPLPVPVPVKAPVALPVPLPVPVPVPVVIPVPVPAPVPVKAPVPVPAPVPAAAPVVVPVPVTAPVTAPVAAPVTAPVAAPVKAPAVAPVPVKAPAVAPVPVTVPVPVTPAPVTEAPVDKSCGLFGFRLFCPLTFCGLFGRIFRASCRD